MIQSLRLLSADKTIELGLFRTRDEDPFRVLLYYNAYGLYDRISSLNGTVKLIDANFEDSIINSTYIESYGTFNQFPSKIYSARNPKTLSFDLKLNENCNNSSFAIKSVFEYILYNTRSQDNPSSGYFYFMAIDNDAGDYEYDVPRSSSQPPNYKTSIYIGKACCTNFDNQIYSDNVIYSIQSSVLKYKTIKDINFDDIMIMRLDSLMSNYNVLEDNYKSSIMHPVDSSQHVYWDDRIQDLTLDGVAARIRLINTIQPPSKFLQRVGTEVDSDNYAFCLFYNEDYLPNNIKITFDNPYDIFINPFIISSCWLRQYGSNVTSVAKPKVYINGCEFSINIQNEIINNLPINNNSQRVNRVFITNLSLLFSKDISGKIECSALITYKIDIIGEEYSHNISQKCTVDIFGEADNIFHPGWIMLTNEFSNLPDAFNIDYFNSTSNQSLIYNISETTLTIEGGD